MMQRYSALIGLDARESQINLNPTLSYKSNYTFKTDHNMADFYNEVFLHKLWIVNYKFLSYCPNIFEIFKKIDNI